MKTASEIKNALDSIKYYNERIKKLSHDQFVEDAELSDINAQVGSIRFDALGAIGAGCSWIETYCLNISKNLEIAVAQDRLLQSKEEEEQWQEEQ